MSDFKDDLSIRLSQHLQVDGGCKCGVTVKIPFLASQPWEYSEIANHFADVVIEVQREYDLVSRSEILKAVEGKMFSEWGWVCTCSWAPEACLGHAFVLQAITAVGE